MKPRPFVFLCCPLTPRDANLNPAVEYLANVRNATYIATLLIKRGFSVYCPAVDFPYWLVDYAPIEARDIYENDLGILKKADVVFGVKGWRNSPNCQEEYEQAVKQNTPFFEDMVALLSWRYQWLTTQS